MKYELVAMILHTNDAGKARMYSHLRVIATSEKEARDLVEKHLSEKKPLGFSEREMRKRNPKRTPWIPGLSFRYFLGTVRVEDAEPIGVICD